MLKIRNVAIIAHVDHGKTTLIDNMLKQSGTFKDHQDLETRIMDSNDIERERGITILAKCTYIKYDNIKINIIDTPGHADFGGEVERVLSIVDGAILLIDASEGVMPQTKFVLSKALAFGLKPIVVINKVDRADSRIDEVLSEAFDLFCSLDATEEQLDFPTLYAVGRDGWASETNVKGKNLQPLFLKIKTKIPEPNVNKNAPFSMLSSILTTDLYLGRILIGKVHSGSAKVGDAIKVIDLNNKVLENTKLTKLFAFHGTTKVYLEKAEAGDIIAISGVEKASVSHTICSHSVNKAIHDYPIDPPTMAITISVNNSPLSGFDGKKITSRIILNRLIKESDGNIAITLKISKNGESFEIGGRGELQLGILIENMRREGFELSVSRPKILFTKDKNDNILEPIEELVIDIDEIYSGIVIKKLSLRKTELKEMKSLSNAKTRLIFNAPSRGLIGYYNEFRNDTKGEGVMNRRFYSYEKYKGEILSRRNGVLISNSDGESTAYSLSSLESRGKMFIGPKTKVYKGMILGQHNRENDLEVNPTKNKQLSNMRASGTDEAIRLSPHRTFSIEETLSYINGDELIEVTPNNIRFRKIILESSKRKKVKNQ